jgi:PhnB protein
MQQLQPYLFFNGRCEEAVDFYRDRLGAEVMMLTRFRDAPMPAGMVSPGRENQIMHAHLRIGGADMLASDGRGEGAPQFQGFSLSLSAASAEDAERMFMALSDGGTVQMPLSKTFFSPHFGIVADRFGVPWMVYVAP